MVGDTENSMRSRGGVRQGKSGAWIFPVHPKEKVRNKQMKELDSELAEVRKIKEELTELRDSLKE